MTGYCNAPIIIKTQGYQQSDGLYFPCVMLMLDGNKNNCLTAECGSGKEIRFDLSSYAKGLLYNMTIDPTENVPSKVIAYRVFIKNIDTPSNLPNEREDEAGSVTVYLGRGDRLARFRGAESTEISYKPESMETVNVGDYNVSIGQSTDVTAVRVTAETVGVYAENNPLRHQIIFLNSFGRWESASALTRESKSYKYNTTQTNVDTNFPDNVDRESIITKRTLEEVVWSMSSGYVTQEWADWWAKEVMAAEYVWLKEGERLIPVSLIPNDSTTVYNKSKGELNHIDFKLKFI